jgi:hypothetical protein
MGAFPSADQLRDEKCLSHLMIKMHLSIQLPCSEIAGIVGKIDNQPNDAYDIYQCTLPLQRGRYPIASAVHLSKAIPVLWPFTVYDNTDSCHLMI